MLRINCLDFFTVKLNRKEFNIIIYQSDWFGRKMLCHPFILKDEDGGHEGNKRRDHDHHVSHRYSFLILNCQLKRWETWYVADHLWEWKPMTQTLLIQKQSNVQTEKRCLVKSCYNIPVLMPPLSFWNKDWTAGVWLHSVSLLQQEYALE